MGLCAGRDKPFIDLEITEDIINDKANSLVKEGKYEVEAEKSKEEVLISMAANMQALRENIRTKNELKITKVQRMRKTKAFGGILSLVQKHIQARKLPPSSSEPPSDPKHSS